MNVEKIMKLSYFEYIEYLWNKYGKVPGDYFLDEKCTKKNTKITRGNEGLNIHHIDDYRANDLSNSAKNYPFEYQKANRLVYCNIIEQAILFMKIISEYKKDKPGLGMFIIPTINDYLAQIEYKQSWRYVARRICLDNKEKWFEIVKYFLQECSIKEVTILPLCESWHKMFYYDDYLKNLNNYLSIFKEYIKIKFETKTTLTQNEKIIYEEYLKKEFK